MGAALTYTEMVSVKGLHYNPDSGASRALLSMDPLEVPCAVQLFGSDPAMIAVQARRLVELHGSDIALIDLNMGCPVSKVTRKGEGSALMRDIPLAAAIVAAVSGECPVPVSVKFRSGWDPESVNAVAFAQAMEGAGAAAVAVHGRTREQFYRGSADWDVIAQVRAAVNVPVLGSGDVFTADDVVAMLERTGVDGVMVARGARGNPWIFREAGALLRGERLPSPTPLERIDMARRHAEALTRFAGERAFVRMRKHVAWYVADMPGAGRIRARVNSCRDWAGLDELLGEYRAYLESDRRGDPS
jgi:nifR3 family TIM-barrel protein